MINNLFTDSFPIKKTEIGFLKEMPKMLDGSVKPKSIPGFNTTRWRDDPGPIGQAIRNGKYDLLKTAIMHVKKPDNNL